MFAVIRKGNTVSFVFEDHTLPQGNSLIAVLDDYEVATVDGNVDQLLFAALEEALANKDFEAFADIYTDANFTICSAGDNDFDEEDEEDIGFYEELYAQFDSNSVLTPAPEDLSEASGFVGISEPVDVPDEVIQEINQSLEEDDNEDNERLDPEPNNLFTIECLNPATGEVINQFVDIHEAAQLMGQKPSAINRVLSGKRKTLAGFGWRKIVQNKKANLTPYQQALQLQQLHGTLFSGNPHTKPDSKITKN